MTRDENTQTRLSELRADVELRHSLPAPAERRTIRKRAGATLEDIARIVGVTPTAVYDWETKDVRLRKDHLRRYSEVLAMLKEETE